MDDALVRGLRAQRDALRWPHTWPTRTREERVATRQSSCIYCGMHYSAAFGKICPVKQRHYQHLVQSGQVVPATEDPFSDEWLARQG